MKPTKIFIPMIMAMLLTSCGETISNSSTSTSSDEQESSYQMIVDNKFERGFSCNPGNGNDPDTGWTPESRWPRTVDLTYGNDSGPVWIMSQHGDIYSLNDHYNKYTGDKTVEEKDGYYTFSDESKVVSVNPTTGSLYLELNASQEYKRPRKSGEQWSHLLINEGFSKAVQMSEVDSVILNVDMEMKKFVDHMGSTALSGVHATQFLMYLVMKSNNTAEDGGFFWFGIPFFDNRYPNGLPESGMVDAGGAGATSKFIYGMPSRDYIEDGVLKLNKKTHIEVDIAPYILSALLLAQSQGYFTKSTYKDLCFQSMNIGFEIPGTYDCGIELSNFTLTANYSE